MTLRVIGRILLLPFFATLGTSACNALLGIEEGQPRGSDGGHAGRESAAASGYGGDEAGKSGESGHGESGGGSEPAAGGSSGEAGATDRGGEGGSTEGNESGGGAGESSLAGAGGDGGESAGAAGGGAVTSGGTGGSGAGSGGTAGASGTAGSNPGPVQCNPVQNDCGSNEYCNAPDCSSLGTCAPRPASSSSTMAPACGCNGTSYWNLQHARWLGVTAFTGDTSGCLGAAARTCTDNAGCTASGSKCVIDHGLGRDSCNAAGSGRCWALPSNANCTGAPNYDVGFGRCSSSATASCNNFITYCDALISGSFYAACL